MRNFDTENCWKVRIGEVKLNHNGENYLVIAGIVSNITGGNGHNPIEDTLYIRLYKKENENEKFIFGKWLCLLIKNKSDHISHISLYNLSSQFLDQIIEEGKRLEKLLPFA